MRRDFDDERKAGKIKDERVLSLLVHIAAHFIAREAGRETLITPTRATMSPDRKNATIFVSVFPDQDRDRAIAYLERQRTVFRDYLKKDSRLFPLPRVQFMFDYGEENRQHLDDLSREADSR